MAPHVGLGSEIRRLRTVACKGVTIRFGAGMANLTITLPCDGFFQLRPPLGGSLIARQNRWHWVVGRPVSPAISRGRHHFAWQCGLSVCHGCGIAIARLPCCLVPWTAERSALPPAGADLRHFLCRCYRGLAWEVTASLRTHIRSSLVARASLFAVCKQLAMRHGLGASDQPP
jgi:hypothetical protein